MQTRLYFRCLLPCGARACCFLWSLSQLLSLSKHCRSLLNRLSASVGTHGSCVRGSKPQRINASTILFRRCIQSLRSSRHFCFSSLKMRCPLRFLTHFLNARHTQKCLSAQSRCLFIASPHRLTASPSIRALEYFFCDSA